MGHVLRYDERSILVCMEMDGFKSINNTYEHAAGDEVLRHVSKVLQNNVCNSDPVGRMGRDEFATLLSRTSWEDVLNRADRHRSRGQHHRQWLARAHSGVESQILRPPLQGRRRRTPEPHRQGHAHDQARARQSRRRQFYGLISASHRGDHHGHGNQISNFLPALAPLRTAPHRAPGPPFLFARGRMGWENGGIRR